MHLVLPVKLGHPGFFCGNLVAKLVSELLLFDSAFSKKVRAQEVDRTLRRLHPLHGQSH